MLLVIKVKYIEGILCISTLFLLFINVVCVDALHTNQQFFCHVEAEDNVSCLRTQRS